MRYRTVGFPALVGALWALAVTGWTGVAQAATEDKPLPSLTEVQQLVVRHFAAMPDYRPGDIIARSQVEALFPQLERLGWKVSGRKGVLGKIPADGDYLIRKLQTPQGRKFMRHIAGYPNAYDRLDRLSWLPQGKQTVHDLIHKTGGDEMIEYLTTTSGGAELGKMLSKSPKGADFNRPTGKIYTAEMLLAHLKKAYAEAAKAPAGK